jgi:hypothetical protein
MALFYIFDEYTDKVDGTGALELAEVVVDALRNPHSEHSPGESKLGEIFFFFFFFFFFIIHFRAPQGAVPYVALLLYLQFGMI